MPPQLQSNKISTGQEVSQNPNPPPNKSWQGRLCQVLKYTGVIASGGVSATALVGGILGIAGVISLGPVGITALFIIAAVAATVAAGILVLGPKNPDTPKQIPQEKQPLNQRQIENEDPKNNAQSPDVEQLANARFDSSTDVNAYKEAQKKLQSNLNPSPSAEPSQAVNIPEKNPNNIRVIKGASKPPANPPQLVNNNNDRSKSSQANARPKIKVIRRNARAPLKPPVGISNGVNNANQNCAFNVVAQLMMHNEKFGQALMANNQTCKDLYEAYTKAENTSNQCVDGRYCRELRHDYNFGALVDAREIILRLLASATYVAIEKTGQTNNPNPRGKLNSGICHLAGPGTFMEKLKNILLSAADYVDVKLKKPPQEFIVWQERGAINPPFNLTLDKSYFTNDTNAKYACDFLVIHEQSNKQSHYTCAKKVGNQWYIMDDANVRGPLAKDDINKYINQEGFAVLGANYKLET